MLVGVISISTYFNKVTNALSGNIGTIFLRILENMMLNLNNTDFTVDEYMRILMFELILFSSITTPIIAVIAALK